MSHRWEKERKMALARQEARLRALARPELNGNVPTQRVVQAGAFSVPAKVIGESDRRLIDEFLAKRKATDGENR